MLVRQAIVCSPRSRALKNNELISRSDQVDDDLGDLLCQWSPGRSGLAFGSGQSISFFQPDVDTYALSRSVVGLGDEYEDERCILSQILLFERDQLKSYQNNIAVLAHVIRSTGLLVLPTTIPAKLPLLDVPDQGLKQLGEFLRVDLSEEIQRLTHAVELHHRVAILGLASPMAFMASFLSALPESTRLKYSFSTDQQIEDARSFTLQFLTDSSPGIVKDLATRQIRTICMESGQVVAN